MLFMSVSIDYLHSAAGHQQLLNGGEALCRPRQVGRQRQLTGLVPAEHVQVLALRDGGTVPTSSCNLKVIRDCECEVGNQEIKEG